MSAPTIVLVVGGGAREHVLAWRLSGEPGVREVHVAPGNAGMVEVATVHPEVGTADLDGLVAVARRLEPDLVVIGPEAPLEAGLVDRLAEDGIPAFGPTRMAARLETSKSFCREIAEAAGIPMAEGAAFESSGEAIGFARRLGAPVVVKADGLAGGKGVVICESLAAAEAAIRAAVDDGAFGSAGRRVVVERRLVGREASLMAICDGADAIALPAARDHKRVGDGDEGPNTGGMGAYSPLPDLPEQEAARLVEIFHRPALAEMTRRGTPFRGVLYAGLMLTDDGPRLLEFNVRFGDPEAEAVLPRLADPLAPTLLAAACGSIEARGALAQRTSPEAIQATVAVMLAAEGYPATPRTGDPIEGLEDAAATGALIFHGATTRREGRLVTNGGRVLTVVGRGDDLAAARDHAYDAARHIRFRGMHYRRDIGSAVGEPAPPLPLLAGAVS